MPFQPREPPPAVWGWRSCHRAGGSAGCIARAIAQDDLPKKARRLQVEEFYKLIAKVRGSISTYVKLGVLWRSGQWVGAWNSGRLQLCHHLAATAHRRRAKQCPTCLPWCSVARPDHDTPSDMFSTPFVTLVCAAFCRKYSVRVGERRFRRQVDRKRSCVGKAGL